MTTVGILGGGQLARMLALSGAPLGLRFLVLDSTADACAAAIRSSKRKLMELAAWETTYPNPA